MSPEEPAHNADTDRLVGCGRFWHQRAWIALRDQPASKRAIDRLQAPVVPALMRQIIGRMASKSVNQVRYGAAFEVVAERLQMLLEKRALPVNLLVARVEHGQLSRADRKSRFGIPGIERTSL